MSPLSKSHIMSYRFMRMIVMFDLPTETLADRREYARFRKYLVTNGFMMLQESIYSKLLLNATVQAAVMSGIRKNKPQDGIVQVLTITEKQFSKMEYLIGEYDGDVVASDKRLLEF